MKLRACCKVLPMHAAPQIRALGPLEIGALVAYALFGLTTSQTYTYFSRFPNDSRKLKLFVAFIWLCEVAHVVAVGNCLYLTTILDYDDPEKLINVPTPILVSFLVNGIISAFIQGFFAARIYRLAKGFYRSIPFVIWGLAVAQLVLSILPILSVSLMGPIALVDFITQQNWAVYSTMGVSVVCDSLIVFGMVYTLMRERDNAISNTVLIVDKLITWTIETGLITSTAAVLELILFATNALSWRWLAIDVLLAGLFSNTLLANLNSRSTLRAMNTASAVDISLQIADMSGLTQTSTAMETTTSRISSSIQPPPFPIGSSQSNRISLRWEDSSNNTSTGHGRSEVKLEHRLESGGSMAV
ncbi:hypothetical protein C8F01DRAFT_467606 [Mycena amicta]|nr:hypothetical protein C8F01DRAFT_467606 [Mycena amicta]